LKGKEGKGTKGVEEKFSGNENLVEDDFLVKGNEASIVLKG